MKPFLFHSLLTLLLLVCFSCKNSPVKEKNAEVNDAFEKTDSFSGKKTSKSINTNELDCDAFLNKYENWSENYIDFLILYQDDRFNKTLNSKFQEYTDQLAGFNEDWYSLYTCYLKGRYQEKYESIGHKIEEASYRVLRIIDSAQIMNDSLPVADTLQ